MMKSSGVDKADTKKSSFSKAPGNNQGRWIKAARDSLARIRFPYLGIRIGGRIRMIKKNVILMVMSAILMVFSFSMVSGAPQSPYIETSFLNQDPDPAEPGKPVEVRWRIDKLGNEKIEDLELELDIDYPFTFDPSNDATKKVERWLGSTLEDEYYILYYKLRVAEDALEDDYTVKLKHKTSADSGWTIKDFDIRVGEKSRPRFVLGNIVTDPKKLIADTDEAEISIKVQNIGDGKADNVMAKLILPEGFDPTYSYSDRYNLGMIDSGSENTAVFYVDTAESLEGKIYEAELEIRYKEGNEDDAEYKTSMVPVEIPLKDSARFEILSVATRPETLKAGDTAELVFQVKNVGGDEAKSVSLRAYKESSQPFEFDEKSDFIGKLYPDDTGEAVLSMNIDGEADAKDYILDIEIRGVEGNKVLVQDKTANFSVENGSKAVPGFNLAAVAGIVALIIVGVLAFNMGKKSGSK